MTRTALLATLSLLLAACVTDADGDGYDEEEDCDDTRADVHPDAAEICNGIDDDCNDLVDDADPAVDSTTMGVFYADSDSDSFGDPDTAVQACAAPDAHVEDATDCDDTTDLANPAAPEICDGIDNDCDAQIDDADDSVDLTTGTTYYDDADDDGFGDPETAIQACTAPDGFLLDGADCDDGDAAIRPDAAEICDEVDNDCDTQIDDADDGLDLSTATTWYADTDADGFGDPGSTALTCVAPDGYVFDDTDCDDGDDAIRPDAVEICDEVDNDCDLLVDDEDDSLDLATASTFWRDGDGDGHGWVDDATRACVLPEGWSDLDDDCDDTDASINPDEVDVPQDGIDQDCSGTDAPYTLTDLAEGDLIITEFMQNPAAVDDADGEWFEVYNSSGGEVDLDGLYVADDDADSFSVGGTLLVAADSYVVFGNNDDTSTNGDVVVDYDYGTAMSLGNGSDELVLADGSSLGTIYDEVAWDDGSSFPDGTGASAQLSDDTWDALDNDDGENWCLGTAAYGDGDLGTPGADNAVCKGPAYTVGYDIPLGATSTHSSNFLLGSRLVLTKAGTLDKFGLISLASGPNVKMALYTDSGGSPGSLVASTSSTALTGAKQEIDISDVRLSAGTYYIVAVYDRTARISYTTATGATVWYRSLAYSSSLPSSFGTPSTYSGQEFAYYLVMY